LPDGSGPPHVIDLTQGREQDFADVTALEAMAQATSLAGAECNRRVTKFAPDRPVNRATGYAPRALVGHKLLIILTTNVSARDVL